MLPCPTALVFCRDSGTEIFVRDYETPQIGGGEQGAAEPLLDTRPELPGHQVLPLCSPLPSVPFECFCTSTWVRVCAHVGHAVAWSVACPLGVCQGLTGGRAGTAGLPATAASNGCRLSCCPCLLAPMGSMLTCALAGRRSCSTLTRRAGASDPTSTPLTDAARQRERCAKLYSA